MNQTSLFPDTTLPPGLLLSVRHGAIDTDLPALLDEIKPRQYQWLMYGKSGDRPRREQWWHDDGQWWHDDGQRYSFGGGEAVKPIAWGPMMLRIKAKVERMTGETFNSCFANYYRGGADTIDWHADDSDWIGPVIASVSFGASRVMRFREKRIKRCGAHRPGHISTCAHCRQWTSEQAKGRRKSHGIELHDGTLLVMPAGTQEIWEHSVPRAAEAEPRLNLTFRQGVA